MSIPLPTAALCVNCEKIVENLSKCPDCQSVQLLALAPVLNRKKAA